MIKLLMNKSLEIILINLPTQQYIIYKSIEEKFKSTNYIVYGQNVIDAKLPTHLTMCSWLVIINK